MVVTIIATLVALVLGGALGFLFSVMSLPGNITK